MALSDCDAPAASGNGGGTVEPIYGALPAPAQAAVGSMSYSATLPGAPTSGNLLIAFAVDSNALPSVNTGWTLYESHTAFTNVNVYGAIAYHAVGGGEVAAQTPFTGSPTHGGVIVIEVAGAAAALADVVESLTWGVPPVSNPATTTISAVTANDHDLAISFTGWYGSVSTFDLTLSESAWGNKVSGKTTGASSELVGSQTVATKGTAVTATCTIGQPFYGMMSAVLILKPAAASIGYVPSGAVSNSTSALVATEALSARNLINVHSGGMRKADKTLNREAHGYVLAAVPLGASALPQFDGKITGLAGLTPGPVYLSTSGALSNTPATAPDMDQQVGIAVSATEVMFQPKHSTRQD